MHSKRNHQQNERQSTEWEKIFAKNVTVKGLIPKTHKHLIQLNIEKANNSIRSWKENLKRHFSKEDTDYQQAHGKMLDITNY